MEESLGIILEAACQVMKFSHIYQEDRMFFF